MNRPAHLLVVRIAEHLRRSKGKDISRDQTALLKVLEAVVTAVQELQTAESVEIHVPNIASDRVGPLHLRYTLTRDEALSVTSLRDVEQLLE